MPGSFVVPQSFAISIIVYKSSNSNSLMPFPVDVPIATSPLCSTRAHAMSESRLQYSYWPWANLQRKVGLAMQLHSRRLLNKLSTEIRIPTRFQLLCQINVHTMSWIEMNFLLVVILRYSKSIPAYAFHICMSEHSVWHRQFI